MIRYLHGNIASVVYFLYCINNNPNGMFYDIITLGLELLIYFSYDLTLVPNMDNTDVHLVQFFGQVTITLKVYSPKEG